MKRNKRKEKLEEREERGKHIHRRKSEGDIHSCCHQLKVDDCGTHSKRLAVTQAAEGEECTVRCVCVCMCVYDCVWMCVVCIPLF